MPYRYFSICSRSRCGDTDDLLQTSRERMKKGLRRREKARAESQIPGIRNSGADGGAESVGEGLAEALDVGVVFGFDHDAGELLRAGVTKDNAAIVA